MPFLNKAKNLLLLCALVSLFACAKGGSNPQVDPIDLNIGLRKEDFNKTIIKSRPKNIAAQEKTTEAPIPNTSRLIVVAPPPSTVTSKTISFAVTDQVPLKDVLIELGRVAKIDIDLDPAISGGIVINARNRPLGEVIDRIATLGGLRYSYTNGILYFERDTPYNVNYSVDYLSEGSNLWADVQANITSILSNSNASATSKSASVASIAEEAAPAPVALARSAVSINKAAGILTAFATKNEHEEIAKYLANVQENSSAQVLIEAKVVEVTLKDSFKAGINWSSFGKSNNIVTTNGYTAGGPISFVATELFNSDITASISALEQFGTSRTLSSPRIHAINNQKALLNFTNKLIYFKIDNTQNTITGVASNTIATLTSTKLEEHVGVELNITPSINLKTSEVTLNIKPKITIKSGEVVDPASPTKTTVSLGITTTEVIQNKVPIIQTRELNTIAKIQSGNVIVIGGLMSESNSNADLGIPFLQRIPILGYLFKSSAKDSETIETIIFVKATIVNSGSAVNKIDRELQEKFDSNRRKFF